MSLSCCPVDIVLARHCLLQSIAKGRKTCPLCHMILNASNLNPIITVKVLLSKVRVYGTNRGCSRTGQHSEKERHGAPAHLC